MSLTGCIKKAGAALSDQDKAAIHEAARRFRKEGKSAQEAGVLAIEAQLEAVRAMLAEAQDKAAAPQDILRDSPLSGVQAPAADVSIPAAETSTSAGSVDQADVTPAQSAAVPESTTPAQAAKAAEAPASKTPTVDAHLALFKAVRAGTATPDDFKAMYRRVRDGKDAITAELNTSTKEQLLKDVSGYVRPGTTKGEIVEAIYKSLLHRFSLGKEYGPQGYFMGQEKAYEKAKRDALDALVEGQTSESLAEYAAEAKAEFDAEVARRTAVMESVKDPKTLEDFRRYIRYAAQEGKTYQQARMSLTPEQRALMDDLAATESRSRRVTRQDSERTSVRVAGQKVDGDIIATKHTRDGHDLYVVRLAERVSAEDYRTLLAGAKRIGGNYSSFRGNGAVPGFQFRTREAAQAFQKLAQGDNTAAVDAAKERRDAYADDRSQTAAERLTEMADRMEADAEESLSIERKANTERRARFAASAEADARSKQAMAKTMRNVAEALTSGKAKFLDRIRTRTQVELLQTYVQNAKGDELRAKYPTYYEQEKRKGQPPTAETADYAEFPEYTSYRSDLASLGRQLLEVDGTKKLGERLMKVADDVGEAFTAWAKEPGNFYRVATFSSKDGGRAMLPSKDAAERAIARSGYRGKAIPWSIKRGEWTVIMSPSEAMARGIWTGDGDKRITLSDEFGAELVEGIGRAAKRAGKASNRLSVPWQFERAYDRRKQLARMGIETPAEFRAALREFIGLREQAAEADRVKAIERAMVGKAKDGLDFFPTPASVADEMVAAADIKPDMAVLEPSAGMGHIADRIRAAGVDPAVVEMANDRRELLEAKGYELVGNDFMDVSGEYDRIIMNPPFSEGRDIQHVRHAYSLLKPGGRIVAIMGESAFTNQNKRATEFRDWLESVGGTDEKLAEGTFNDPTLPVNTSANARMVVIDKPGGQADAQTSQDASGDAPAFSRSPPRVESGTAENGLPTFSTARVSLEFPQETERFEVITEPGETVVNYPIMPSGSFDVVGHVEILVRDGTPTSLLDIEVYDDNRGSGYARQVVEALLAANPAGELNISNIVEGARGFWSKMGVPEQNLEAGAAYDGTLTWETYQQAQDGGAAQGTPGASRGARAQRDAGTAGARAGDLGQVQRHQALIERITATWENAPRVVVVSGMDDPQIPQAVRREDQRQRSLGATGVPEGFYFDGTVYLVAPELANEADVARVLFHEALGHAGLRGVFGAEIGKVLDLVAAGRQQDMQKMAARYGKDLTKPADRRYVAEEVLAMLAQDRPTMNLVQRAVAAVRNFLRRLGLRLELSDNDIIANYILPAQGWIERGGEAVTVQRREQASEGDAAAAPADASPVNFSRSIADTLRDRLNDAKAIELPTGYLLGDLLKSTGRVSWWHKTVGTMHDLAQREPLFRPVYDRAQRFLSDVSLYATEAADMAPKVLPKLETLADITKSPLSAADTKKLSAPVFEGTLSWVRDEQGRPVRVETARQAAAAMSAEEKGRAMLRTGAISEQVLRMWQGLPIEQFEAAIETRYEREMLKPGVVWSDIELSSMFGLSPAQIGLYREVRAAVDKSLTHLAVSDIVRFGGSDLAPIADELMASASVADAKAAAIARIDSLLESQPDRRDVLNDTASKIIAKADTAADLMARGYAPLMRFGRYTVDVLDADGERVFFGMYETEREANKMARELGSEFPRARVTQGTMSQEQFKMFQGVSPETAELFGEMMGLESTGDAAADKAFQQWLKLAKANRSAMKRLIERKGTAGFSEDAGRVLAGFVYSNARQTSKNLHTKPMSDAVMNIADQKGQGELLDVAVQLQQYMMNPQEEAQALRGLLFAQFLGGSVAAGLVNLTQPLMVTFPYLSQFGGVAKAAGRMRKGLADALAWESGKKTTGDAALDAAIKRAEDEGIISPQEVHQLIAQAGGAGSLRSGDGTTLGDLSAKASNFMSKVMLAWGKPFSAAEQFNRRATFIAAYRTAVDQGIDNPAAFAEQAINDTQFVYNKGSRPAWARGAVGSVLFTFKVYSISYVELMARLAKQGPEGRRAALVGLGMLVLTAGLQGLPGADDLDDLIDGLMQRLGYNWSTKTKKREILSAAFGDGLSEFMMRGMSGLPGAPIDVANRLGLGNLIPGTGILTKKDAYGRDVMEILGPAGSLMTQIATAAGKLVEGEVGSAVKAALPVALQNVAQAADMASMGMYRDRDGKKVIDTDLVDAAVKSIGFQPSDVAKVQSAANEQTRLISMNRMREREIADKLARGMFEGDQGMVQEAREELRQWNEENPTSPIRIKTAQLLDRLKAMRSTRAERLAKTAPSEIRASVRRELESAQ